MAWSDPLTQHFHAARVYSVIFDKERKEKERLEAEQEDIKEIEKINKKIKK